MRIGIDFDNTLINYAGLFARVALERSLISPGQPRDKTSVRDHLRTAFGDEAWQRVQVAVYGHRIHEGTLMPGVRECLVWCREQQLTLSIVSHKTQFARIAPEGPDLRQAALDWMEAHRFFAALEDGGLGFARGDVFFAATRQEKVERINALQMDAFIDDLPEVLEHPALTPTLRRMHFTQDGTTMPGLLSGDWPRIHTWLREMAG